MKCSKCGNELKREQNFCNKCGEKAPQPNKECSKNENNSNSNTTIQNNNLMSNIIAVIISIIIIAFIGNSIYVNKVNGNKISTADIKYIISKFNSRVIYVDSNYKVVEDGNGRTIGDFTYTANPYNRQGMTLTNQTYTEIVRIMFMKKNNTVQYAICPSNWLMQSTYKDYNDFKLQNNWGKSESLGLGSNSKSFKSE